MNRGGRGNRALRRRRNDKAVATRLAFDLDRTVAFIGHAMKRDEAIALPEFGALGILAVHPHAQHTDLEMGSGLDGCTVPARLDRVAVGADIAECRVRNPIDKLSRRLGNGSAGGERTDHRDEPKGADPQRLWHCARASIALRHTFPLAKCRTLRPEPEIAIEYRPISPIQRKYSECTALRGRPSRLG